VKTATSQIRVVELTLDLHQRLVAPRILTMTRLQRQIGVTDQSRPAVRDIYDLMKINQDR
jgi:hypothetical protein